MARATGKRNHYLEPEPTIPMADASADKPVTPAPSEKEEPSRARRIYGYTCNLLATAIVLYAAVTFGRQVMSWWQVEKPALQQSGQDLAQLGSGGLSNPDLPLSLEIGDWPAVLTRAEFSGDAAAAQKELRLLCQRSLKQATFPEQPAGPAEQKLLENLARQKPLTTLPGGWELYEQPGPIPFVAAVGTLPRGSLKPTGPLKTGVSPGPQVASAARRVVSWGLGVHLAGTRWTLLLLTTQSRTSHPGFDEWRLPLPPDAKRGLSLGAAEKEAILSFTGPGPVDQWQTFYDQHFASSDSAGKPAWQKLGDVWQKRYETPTTLVEIQLGTNPSSDQIQGLITVRAKPTAAGKGSDR